jgi:demethylmenaquinone methyltransferase/2-methoxy-6-polyprenyl-1,4-benzoquinol methylase
MKPYNSNDKTKKEEVREMFDNIAPTYDKLNHIFSLSIDKIWRRRVVRLVRRLKPMHILDLATGTGDLAIKMAKRIPEAHIMGVDLSDNMLAVAAEKIRRRGLDDHIALYQGDAENLELGDSSVDVVTVAFGVRNFENLEGGLKEIHRTLREGGKFVVLELSVPKNRLIRWFYAQYSHRILPGIGAMISKDKQAYVYLPESIDEFPAPERFVEILKGVGFKDVKRRKQSFGVAHIYEAVK